MRSPWDSFTSIWTFQYVWRLDGIDFNLFYVPLSPLVFWLLKSVELFTSLVSKECKDSVQWGQTVGVGLPN